MAPSSPRHSSASTPPVLKTEATGDTVTELDTSAPEESSKSPVSIDGALLDLLRGAILPCVPVILITTLLLTLIFYHQVDLDRGWELLQTPLSGAVSNADITTNTVKLATKGGDRAYYVRYNPATLAAIASWTSKIIPYLTSSSMAVIAFFAGRRILNASAHDKAGQLPTPHQMSILINLLRGSGASPLWDAVVYRWEHPERMVQPIGLAFGALSYLMIISLLIGAADTWFATSTKPMNVAILTRHNTPVSGFARDFNPNMRGDNLFQSRPCPQDSKTMCNYPCSIANWNFTATGGGVTLKEGIKGAQEAAETLLGNSYLNLVQNTSYQADAQDYGAQQYYFLGDVSVGNGLDFLANTTSVSTQCEVVTQNCQLNTSGDGFTYAGYRAPSFTYSGAVGVDPAAATAPINMSMVGIQFFKDAGLQSPIGFGNQTTDLFTAQNPVHFLTWSKGFPPLDTSTQTFNAMRQGNYLQIDSTGDDVFVLNCTSTIYKTAYAWVNGTILQGDQSSGFYPYLAPDSYGAIFTAPFAIDSSLSHLALEDAAALAAYKTTPQDLANSFADGFSHAAVALTAGIMTLTTNLLEQTRNNTELLTRVPTIPLYFLISLNALYALTALLSAALAVFLTNPSRTQEIKARLTVDGLAAGLFEPATPQGRAVEQIEKLYGEHRPEHESEGATRVGIKQTKAEGGWVWVATGRKRMAWKGNKNNHDDARGDGKGEVYDVEDATSPIGAGTAHGGGESGENDGFHALKEIA